MNHLYFHVKSHYQSYCIHRPLFSVHVFHFHRVFLISCNTMLFPSFISFDFILFIFPRYADVITTYLCDFVSFHSLNEFHALANRNSIYEYISNYETRTELISFLSSNSLQPTNPHIQKRQHYQLPNLLFLLALMLSVSHVPHHARRKRDFMESKPPNLTSVCQHLNQHN